MKKLLRFLLVVIFLGAGYYSLVWSWSDKSMEEIPDNYFSLSGYDANIPLENNGLAHLQNLVFTYSGLIHMLDDATMPNNDEAIYGIPLTGSQEKIVYVGETFMENRGRYNNKLANVYSGSEQQIKMLSALSYNLLQQQTVWQDTKVGTGSINLMMAQTAELQGLIRILNAAALYNCSIKNYNDCSIFFSIAYGLSYKMLHAKSHVMGTAIALGVADHTLANIQASVYNFGFTGDDQNMFRTVISMPIHTQQIITDALKSEYAFLTDILQTVNQQSASGMQLSDVGNYDSQEVQSMLKNHFRKLLEGRDNEESDIDTRIYGTDAGNLSFLQKKITAATTLSVDNKASTRDKISVYLIRNGGGLAVFKKIMPALDSWPIGIQKLETRRETIVADIN